MVREPENEVKFLVKFYASCSHIEEGEGWDNFKKHYKSLRDLGWKDKKDSYYNIDRKPELTIENNSIVCHIHPLRYSCCSNCFKKELSYG